MTPTSEALMEAVCGGATLSEVQADALFETMLTGAVDESRIEAALIAMGQRGETVDEIVGAARVLRRHVTPIACDAADAIDTCGTGGDGVSTFNVSTAAAMVAAAAGATVAKHGNRSFTRASGSAEVLAELGVNIDAPPAVVARCLRKVRIGFLHAAQLHPAMARVAAVRRRIGRRTLFNLLGPLTNPAGVRRQVVGVPHERWLLPIAEALRRLGAARAMVVCGHGGLCDLSITGPSRCVSLIDGEQTSQDVLPELLGLARSALDDLRVSSPRESAESIDQLLTGETGPRRDHLLLNAAAALVVAGIAADLREGLERAAAAIDSGAARHTLARWVRASHEGA